MSTQPTSRELRQSVFVTSRQQTQAAWTILGIALAARLWVIAFVVARYPHDWLFHRGIEMGLLANSLIHGLGYSSPFGGSTGPTAFIAPGYPTLIAGIFLMFGSYSLASAIVIMGLQTLLSVLTIWLMMQIAQETMDERTAKLAGGFWAISYPLLFIPTIFWDTSISACALAGMTLFALRAENKPAKTTWILFGLCCGVAGLINPALLPTLIAILGWAAHRSRRRVPSGLPIALAALLLLFIAWPIRNAYRFHAFIPLRSTVGFELWMGNRPGATGFLDESLFPMYNKAELASYIAKGEVKYTRDKSDAAKAYIFANPGKFIVLTARRVTRFWSGTGNFDGSPFFELHALLTTMLGALGLWLLARRGKRALACLLSLPLLLFPFPYYITHAEFRYRLEIDPLLTVLAAYALTQIVARSEPTVAPCQTVPSSDLGIHPLPKSDENPSDMGHPSFVVAGELPAMIEKTFGDGVPPKPPADSAELMTPTFL